jgi:hypothetical protein
MAFFKLLSSVPVKNRTSCPRCRQCRAIMSASTSSIANPKCGLELTYGMAVVM